MFRYILYTLFLILQCSISLHSQESVSAKIQFKSADNLFDIKGVAKNNTPTYQDEYNYLLLVLKKGAKGNYSQSNQSGEFSLAPEEEKVLSKTKLNIEQGELCKIYLFIRKNKELVSKDSVEVSLRTENEKQAINEDEIGIKGLVVEDTKTKPGKDFYDYYYQLCLSSEFQFPFIVRINEKPALGRSSQISVLAEEKLIYQFRTTPSDEYIHMNAKRAFMQTYAYYTKRKLLFNKEKKF